MEKYKIIIMEYKVGDKVKIINIEKYNELKSDDGTVYFYPHPFTQEMCKYCGKTVTIDYISDMAEGYKIKEDDSCLIYWTDDMIECKVEPLYITIEELKQFIKDEIYNQLNGIL